MSTYRETIAIATLAVLFVSMALALAMAWPRPWFEIQCQIKGGDIEHMYGGDWCAERRGALTHFTPEP